MTTSSSSRKVQNRKKDNMSGDEDDVEIIDNAILGMAMMWADQTTVANAEKLVQKHFQHSYKDVHDALVLLWEKTGKMVKKPAKHTKNDKFELSSRELIDLIIKLKDHKEQKVKVIMTPRTLAMVPIMESTWGEGDEASTSARLLNLERQMSEMRLELTKGVQVMTQSRQALPPKTEAARLERVQTPYAEIASRPGAGSDRTEQRKRKTGSDTGTTVNQPQLPVHAGQEDGFQLVKGRKKKQPRNVHYGTGNTGTGGAGGEAAPYEVWIGNTHPDSTKEIIQEVLLELGKRNEEKGGLSEDLKILECECLTKARTDGSKPYTIAVENQGFQQIQGSYEEA